MHRTAALVSFVVGFGLIAGCKDDAKQGETKQERVGSQAPQEPVQSEATLIAPVVDSKKFPTASAAGTKELFFLEEPDRGKHITKVAIPAGGKTTMKSGFCEVDEHDVVCVPGAGRYRVRQVASTRIVEELRDGNVADTYVIERDGQGDVKEIARVDQYGDVDWVRSYTERGTRYSSRHLSGGNQLAGCGARALELDAKGQATAATCLQWNGSPMLDTSGVARSSLTRNAQGLVERIEFYGVENEPISRNDNVHAMAYTRSTEGFITRRDNLGLDGKPVLSTRNGCASTEHAHDTQGDEIKNTCLGEDGSITANLERIGWTVTERDALGCEVSRSFFGPTGEPQSSRRRGYEERYVVNKRCEIEERTCHDAEGALVNCEQGVAKRTYTHDGLGRVVSVKHFDTQGKPGRDPAMQRFELRYKYDPWGNQVERSCFDAKEQPVECSGTGAHVFVEIFDEAGRNVETRYLNRSRQPTKSLGTSVSRSIYDNYDHTSQVLREDEQGNLISSNGMSKMTFLYDPGHQIFGVLLLDADDKPAHYGACFVGLKCPSQPWHALRVMRSANGQLLSNIFFDAQKLEIKTVDCATSKCFGQ
tara:strand:- start:48084 stop:49856 length:1773 start_codon:yes stop_codon:yes gene_type:complete